MHVPWKRFWTPLGDPISCGFGGRGFLDDPGDSLPLHYNAHLVSLEDVRERPCLLLLGEPGMGKTSTLEAERPEFERIYGTQNVLWIRFRDIPDTQTFVRRTVSSPKWVNWTNEDYNLLLVIDGIDEGLMKIPEFISFLRSELEQVDRNRLRIILACRLANWPVVAGGELLELWPGELKSKAFELCPLRRIDAHQAAHIHGLDGDAFVRALYDTNVVGLALRPVTLFMLLGSYSRSQGFPNTYRELYQQGCQILGSEVDQGRLEQMRPRMVFGGLPSEEQKLTIAKRIAALLMLGGKSAVYLGPIAQRTATDLHLSEIALGVEATNGHEFTVSDLWALEALSTALFTYRGENRLGFTHQTFAEALAAGYLSRLPLTQLRTLLCQRDATKQHVIPQLAEVSAWLAGEHAEFLDFLLANEPEILLRSDFALISAENKRRLLTSLLEAAKREEVFDSADSFYSALRYEGMEHQLVETIRDKNSNFVARRMAADIAGTCKVAELVTPLLDTLRDAAEANDFKRRCARALAELTPPARLGELVPLAEGSIGADPDDELRGSALEVLVPHYTSLGNAVPWLARPVGNTLGGTYWRVLHYELPKAITAPDLPALLGLVAERDGCFNSTSSFKELADKTFCLATEHLDDPAVAAAFVAAWLSKVRNHRPLPTSTEFKFNTIFREQCDLRRRIIELIVTSPLATAQDARRIGMAHRPVLSQEDLPWLLERLLVVPAAARANWIELLHWQVFPASVVRCWDLFLETLERSEELKQAYGNLFRAWEPDEPIAVKAKADLEEERRFAAEHQQPPAPQREPYIQELIAAGLAGNPRAWLDLSLWLFLAEGQRRVDNHNMDITEAPGWKEADENRQTQVRQIARDFLITCADAPHSPGTHTNYTLPGYKALILLGSTVRNDLALKEAVQAKWLDTLFEVPWDDAFYKKSTALAFDLSPELRTRKLEESYAEDRDNHRFTTILRALKERWTGDLSDVIKNLLLQDPRADSIHHVIDFLVQVDRPAAVATLTALLRTLEIAPDTDLLRNALATGISNLTEEMLPTIYPVLNADREMARLVFLHVANHSDASNHLLTFSKNADDLGELYVFFREVFPPAEDPPMHGDLGARWAAARLRDQQLVNLSSLGTMDACRVLLSLAARFPQESIYFKWRHKECLNVARTRLWTPFPPRHILQFVEKGTNRLITNEGDLIEVVMESLQRLEGSLVATLNPSVIDLWNYQGGGNNRRNFVPKDEEDLSGKIAAWLQTDLARSRGVILNREVQPRRGLRTDVTVDAVTYDGNEASRLTIVIEVKGCWNNEIPVAIQDQLINDYLAPHNLTHGIFLVGWFMCDKWDTTVKRKISYLTSRTIEAAREEVVTMAAPFNGADSLYVIRGFVLDCRVL